MRRVVAAMMIGIMLSVGVPVRAASSTWTSSVISEQTTLGATGDTIRDSVIERVSSVGAIIRITTHSSQRDTGQAFSKTGLAYLEFFKPGETIPVKAIDFAVSLAGTRGAIVNGQQAVSLHVVQTGRPAKDVTLLVDVAKWNNAAGLSLEQGLRQYADPKVCNCGIPSASLYGQFKSWLVKVGEWFAPTASALDCMNYCFENGYDCYLLGLFTGLEGYLSCIGACVAACIAIEILGG